MEVAVRRRNPGARRRCDRSIAPALGILSALLIPAALAGCSPGYVLRAAWEEARILANRRPIAEMLDDPSVDERTRAKLELVVEARGFAARNLDLDVGESYTSYSDIGRDTLAFILSASPVDRLAAYTWSFPVVGRFPYKGFFSLEAAREAASDLEARNYDTYIRPTSAFSTLGWFPDPLMSTVLRQDSLGLVETVIHEVTHNTLFVTGQVKFNESFANFVGSVGAIEFYCRSGRSERLCELANGLWNDNRRLSEFLDWLWQELESLYAQDLPVERLIPRRRELLELAGRRFDEEYVPSMRMRSSRRFDPRELNNAKLIARHLYYHRLPLFHALYESGGGDLRATIQRIARATEEATDPWTSIERLLESEAARQGSGDLQ